MKSLRIFSFSLVHIILLFQGNIKAQDLGLYDAAIELASLIDGSDSLDLESANRVFRSAGFDPDNLNLEENFLLRKYSSEPCFLNPETNELDCTSKDQAEGFVLLSPKSTGPGAVPSASGKSLGKAISGLPVTNLADGLSIFLVNRAKKELSIAFFDKLTNKIEEYPVLTQNFPSTTLQMNAIGTDIYQYEKFIQSLRQAFITDFKGLPGNFGRYLMANEQLIKKPAPRAIAGDALHMMQAFISSENFSSIVHYLASDTSYIQSTNAPELDLLKPVLQTTDVVLHAFQKTDESWVDFNDFNKMMQNQRQLDMFFALILLEAEQRDIKFPGRLTFSQILANQDHAKAQLSGMIFQVNQLVLYLKNMQGQNKENNFEDYYNILTSLFSIAETGYRLLPGQFQSYEDESAKFFRVANNLSSLTLYVYQKKYSASVTQLVSVVRELKLVKEKEVVGTKSKGTKSIENYIEKQIEKIQRYANFFALIAEAEDGNSLASIIDQYAAPVGSSVEKRKNPVTFGLNGYVGLNGFGKEIATTENVIAELQEEPFYALSAPVGISVNFGIKEKVSLGIFTSLIDVGAITAYRFDDENTEELPEVTLGNIFAPGLHLELGVGNLPITIGYGWQWGPNLRKVTNEALEITEFSTRRQSAFIRVDIPVMWF